VFKEISVVHHACWFDCCVVTTLACLPPVCARAVHQFSVQRLLINVAEQATLQHIDCVRTSLSSAVQNELSWSARVEVVVLARNDVSTVYEDMKKVEVFPLSVPPDACLSFGPAVSGLANNQSF